MAKAWIEPRIEVQRFVPDEYVAVCVGGSIQCAYPGNGSTNGQTNVFDDYTGKESGYWQDDHDLWHGICGNEAQISFNSDTASGYEVINGVTQYDRRIFDVANYELSVGMHYNVTWKSQLTGDDHVYHHVGRLTIKYLDENRPNHS